MTFGYPIIEEMERVLSECFPDISLISYFCFDFFIGICPVPGRRREQSFEPLPRHQPHAAQLHRGQRFPPQSSAARSSRETPDKRAISPARRYSGASVISDPPAGLLAVRWRLPLERQIHGQPGAPAGARAQSAHRAPQMGCSSVDVELVVGAYRPEYGRVGRTASKWPNRSQFYPEAPFRIVRTRLRQASSENSIFSGLPAAWRNRMRGPSAIPSLGRSGAPTEVAGSLPVILR